MLVPNEIKKPWQQTLPDRIQETRKEMAAASRMKTFRQKKKIEKKFVNEMLEREVWQASRQAGRSRRRNEMAPASC